MSQARRAKARVPARSENKSPLKNKREAPQSICSPAEQILFLQRTIGNQTVGRLIRSGALKAKLRIGKPDDIYEQETGGAAGQVMRMPESQVSNETKVPENTASEGGKRMYRTGDGKMVELPPDMTAQDAAKLESEAKAAEKKLGKRPPPKPDVKKPAIKEEKKEKPKPEVKGKKDDKGKGKAASKAGSAATAVIEAVGHSEVAKYLARRGAPILVKGMGRLQELRQNEQTHDNAAEKLNQSEKAVVIPPGEGQSQSNAGQVNAVSAKPVPTIDENKAKQKLEESLQENIPQTIEDVDNFKSDKKAQRMGADVMNVVRGDKNAVISTFADMEHTPPPAPPEHTPVALPPEEIAPPTASMDLGQGAVAPLQKEHTDLSNFTKEADSKLKEEDITQEQLDMVDSGDLAEANREKKGMETTAKSEPVAVQKFAQQESEKVDRDLKQEEKKEREGLKVKRKASLTATSQHQKGAKTAIEKQRDEVAGKINGMFKSAQDKVKKKLADLETASMKRFDDGNAKATKEFEDNVKRELDAYKEDRYSGFFGWARKAKDWLLGMDKLPRVKAIFENNRATFVNTINKLVDNIAADNKRVIQECKDELSNAREEIKKFVDKLGPDLKDIGKKAAEEMNKKLDDLDQFVAKKEQELQDKLKDKQQAAIKAIDEKIAKMKEAMSGALSKLGKLLLYAAKKFFTWALEKFGFSLDEIEGIINKGAAVLKAIFTKPVQFVKNLINAASTGFKNFGTNFLKHLKDAVFEWLTGSLVGIILPERWDLKGILSVIFQMLGITYENIRSHLVKLIPEPVVKSMETTFTLVKTLITEGPMAAWEQLKDIAGEMKDTFIDAVKDWIKWKVIQEAIKTIISMFIPGAGIIRAIVGIYDTIVFFIKKAKDILQMIGNFLGSIAEIAAGNISGAAEALENGLARGLKLVIDFLAKFLHLDGITQKIRDVIQNIRGKVDNVIGKVALWVVDKGKKLWGKLTGKDKEKKTDERMDEVKDKKDEAEASPVIAKVKQELATRIPAAAKDKAEIQSVINDIYTKFSPEGLKTVRVEPDGNHFAIKVSASPVDKGGTFDVESSLDLSDLTTQFFAKTILVATIKGKQYKRTSGGGIHAEELLIRDLNENWDSLGSPSAIDIDINRAPCGPELKNCAGRLSEFARTKNVRLTVRAASPYPSDPSWFEALRTLKAEPNINLMAWNVLGTLKSRFDIDPEDVKPDVRAKIQNRLKRLLEVRAEFYKIMKG